MSTVTIGDVGLDAQLNHGQVFHPILARIQPSDQPKALAVMEVPSDRVQLRTELGKGESVLSDEVAVKATCYCRVSLTENFDLTVYPLEPWSTYS